LNELVALSVKRLLLDAMLGKLARFLRIFGYDVEYSRELDDRQLLQLAKESDRILVTRDVDLYRRALMRNIPAILITEQSLSGMVAELMKEGFSFEEQQLARTRCPVCNTPLRQASKEEVRQNVPPASLRRYNQFYICEACGKVYWLGSHWRNIRSTLKRAHTLLERRATKSRRGKAASPSRPPVS